MTYAAAVPMSPVSPSRAGTESRATHLYVMVAACAVIVYLGALWNRFAFDDVAIVVMNPLVGHLSGLWKAFAAPYWTPDLGGSMYRPLTIATFAVDRAVDGAAWLHAVNLAWHAAASVAVAALARRWTNNAGALAAGLLCRPSSTRGGGGERGRARGVDGCAVRGPRGLCGCHS